MAPEVLFSTATLEHAEAMAPLMRAEDLAEIQACGYPDALTALREGVQISRYAWAATFDGEVGALFGVVAEEGGIDRIWFLTAQAFARHPMAFARVARSVMVDLLAHSAQLMNYIDCRYSAAMRWAKWLGFTIEEPKPYGPEGRMFCLAHIRSPAWALQE